VTNNHRSQVMLYSLLVEHRYGYEAHHVSDSSKCDEMAGVLLYLQENVDAKNGGAKSGAERYLLQYILQFFP
jgi:hypothetical protein